jgi:hypothetical protein
MKIAAGSSSGTPAVAVKTILHRVVPNMEIAQISFAAPILLDVAVRSENVHLEEKFVFIPDGKTKTARRNVPLTEKAAEAIARRMKAGYLFPHRLDPAKPMIWWFAKTRSGVRS